MKIDIQSKKGLTTVLSISVDKKSIQKKMEERLSKVKDQVSLKGFRPGKVPSSVIKSQFGKAIYGEVIDQLLKESTTKAIEEKKLKVAGQPKIDLKSFGEGKDLNFELKLDILPDVKLKPLEKISIKEYEIDVENKIVKEKIKELLQQNKDYKEVGDEIKSEKDNQITFDYSATINGEKFEGSEGKGVQIILGKDLFLKNFDKELIGLKKGQEKIINSKLPPNHPKKELADKLALFKCKVIKIQKAIPPKLDDEFAKKMGAKSLIDLENLVKSQISLQYKQTLESITKKKILDELEKIHNFDIPGNLLENEINLISQSQKEEDKKKFKKQNEQAASSRIKIGLVLNEIGEKNKLKVNDEEIKKEIQKQVQSMPGQEKLILDYYQKNPSASQNIKGQIYEDKIIKFIKTKVDLKKIKVNLTEAQKIIDEFTRASSQKISQKESDSQRTKREKSKKISKK